MESHYSSNSLTHSSSSSSLQAFTHAQLEQPSIHSDRSSILTNNTLGAPLTDLPHAPRARANTFTSEDIRHYLISPVEHVERLKSEILTTLNHFESTTQPRLPEKVYVGLRRCANEMDDILFALSQPHIKQQAIDEPGACIQEADSGSPHP